jgi:heme exporter protein D
MADWLEMGGYGAYVWGSYGAAALVLAALIAVSWRRLRASRALLAGLERTAPRRSAPEDDGGDDTAR